jgi:hypothetical protein
VPFSDEVVYEGRAMQRETVTTNHAEQLLPVAPEQIENAWFDAAKAGVGTRRSSLPPAPPEKVGEFLGDELADSWLR